MNRLFAELVNQQTPKYNPLIVNGLACVLVPYAQEWLHVIFQEAAKSFPKGLTYDGCERCTPREEFFEATKVRNNKRQIDLADSDIFLVKYKFSFEDEHGVKQAIPDRYMYLPFVNEAGILSLSGTKIHLNPVLSDKVISPNINGVFVRLMRDRITFRHVGHSVLVDNQRETFNVVWSGIYRKQTKDRSAPPTTNAYSSIAHYLFARDGLTKTFEKYAGFVPGVGHYTPGQEFDPNMVICRSSYYGTQHRPSTVIGGYGYKPSDLYLEIPKQHWNSKTAALVSGFFYVVDHFPDRMQADRVDSKFLWSVLLGNIIFSGVYSEAKLFENIREHFLSLDDYLDGMVQVKLREIGWKVDDFYDLIAKIMMDFPSILFGSQMDTNSMFNKNAELLYYMLAEIAFKIFKVNYQLRKSKAKKPLSYRTVSEAFNKIMTARSIFNLQKNKMIAENVSYCGDHKYPKLTSKITEQEAGSSKFRKKAKRVVLSESNHIHSSMVEAGNALFLSKSNPMPNAHINPYVQIDMSTGTLIPDPQFAKCLEELQAMLTRTNAVQSDEFEFGLIENDDNGLDREQDSEEMDEDTSVIEADLDDESD